MYPERVKFALGAVCVSLWLCGCTLWQPKPLWQPEHWPLTHYRVSWPTADGEWTDLWVAVEADASGLEAVVLSPQGVKLLSARLSDGELEQRRSPAVPDTLQASTLLQAWQLAFGNPAAVAAQYGESCRLQGEDTQSRRLFCDGHLRALIERRGPEVRVRLGDAAVQRWLPL